MRADHKTDVVQHLFAVNGLGNPFDQQYIVADLPVLLEAAKRIAAAGRLNCIHLQVVQQFFAAGRLLCLRSVRAETRDKVLQFLYFLFYTLVLVFQLPLRHLRVAVPEIVVADKHSNFAIVNIRDIRTDFIQKMPVMRNYNDCIFKIHQEILQPFDGVNIQMVGRLVQQQNIRISE